MNRNRVKTRAVIAGCLSLVIMFCALAGASPFGVVYAGNEKAAQKLKPEPIRIADNVQEDFEVHEREGIPYEAECSAYQYPEFVYSKDWDADDGLLLAKIAETEAGNQNIITRELVILCVLNRVWSDEFPNTIEEVLRQPGQFTPVMTGKFDKAVPSEDSWQAVENVMLAQYNISDGCLYFESFETEEEAERSWHGRALQFLYQSQDMRFYK